MVAAASDNFFSKGRDFVGRQSDYVVKIEGAALGLPPPAKASPALSAAAATSSTPSSSPFISYAGAADTTSDESLELPPSASGADNQLHTAAKATQQFAAKPRKHRATLEEVTEDAVTQAQAAAEAAAAAINAAAEAEERVAAEALTREEALAASALAKPEDLQASLKALAPPPASSAADASLIARPFNDELQRFARLLDQSDRAAAASAAADGVIVTEQVIRVRGQPAENLLQEVKMAISTSTLSSASSSPWAFGFRSDGGGPTGSGKDKANAAITALEGAIESAEATVSGFVERAQSTEGATPYRYNLTQLPSGAELVRPRPPLLQFGLPAQLRKQLASLFARYSTLRACALHQQLYSARNLSSLAGTSTPSSGQWQLDTVVSSLFRLAKRESESGGSYGATALQERLASVLPQLMSLVMVASAAIAYRDRDPAAFDSLSKVTQLLAVASRFADVSPSSGGHGRSDVSEAQLYASSSTARELALRSVFRARATDTLTMKRAMDRQHKKADPDAYISDSSSGASSSGGGSDTEAAGKQWNAYGSGLLTETTGHFSERNLLRTLLGAAVETLTTVPQPVDLAIVAGDVLTAAHQLAVPVEPGHARSTGTGTDTGTAPDDSIYADMPGLEDADVDDDFDGRSDEEEEDDIKRLMELAQLRQRNSSVSARYLARIQRDIQQLEAKYSDDAGGKQEEKKEGAASSATSAPRPVKPARAAKLERKRAREQMLIEKGVRVPRPSAPGSAPSSADSGKGKPSVRTIRREEAGDVKCSLPKDPLLGPCFRPSRAVLHALFGGKADVYELPAIGDMAKEAAAVEKGVKDKEAEGDKPTAAAFSSSASSASAVVTGSVAELEKLLGLDATSGSAAGKGSDSDDDEAKGEGGGARKRNRQEEPQKKRKEDDAANQLSKPELKRLRERKEGEIKEMINQAKKRVTALVDIALDTLPARLECLRTAAPLFSAPEQALLWVPRSGANARNLLVSFCKFETKLDGFKKRFVVYFCQMALSYPWFQSMFCIQTLYCRCLILAAPSALGHHSPC